CACNKIATKDRSKAAVYLDYLFREIEMQAALYDKDRLVEQLHWGGGTPTFLDHAQMTALMAQTRAHFPLLGEEDEHRDYSIELDPRAVQHDTLSLLRQLGFNRFSLGVQDVDPEVQQAVNRIQSLSQTRTVIEACRAQQAKSVSVDLIYGLPRQTLGSFLRTLDAIVDLQPDRLSVFNYAHMPQLFKPQRRINPAELPSAEEKLDILRAAVEHLTAAGYEYIGMDHFARPEDELARALHNGSLHRNFQGYTTHADSDLVAMGVSAISSVAGCYSQNAKTLDEYYVALDNGELPVVRGISLDEDDMLRRAVIQQLSCRFELKFAPLERLYGVTFRRYFAAELTQLQELAADGLVELADDRVRVTGRGRFLIRTVCMVFDAYLQQQGQQRFSKVI
ncbi:MAG: oxygen-independent coproporphyrinogen III oxidase, partial [Thiolinea sp.]